MKRQTIVTIAAIAFVIFMSVYLLPNASEPNAVFDGTRPYKIFRVPFPQRSAKETRNSSLDADRQHFCDSLGKMCNDIDDKGYDVVQYELRPGEVYITAKRR